MVKRKKERQHHVQKEKKKEVNKDLPGIIIKTEELVKRK